MSEKNKKNLGAKLDKSLTWLLPQKKSYSESESNDTDKTEDSDFNELQDQFAHQASVSSPEEDLGLSDLIEEDEQAQKSKKSFKSNQSPSEDWSQIDEDTLKKTRSSSFLTILAALVFVVGLALLGWSWKTKSSNVAQQNLVIQASGLIEQTPSIPHSPQKLLSMSGADWTINSELSSLLRQMNFLPLNVQKSAKNWFTSRQNLRSQWKKLKPQAQQINSIALKLKQNQINSQQWSLLLSSSDSSVNHLILGLKNLEALTQSLEGWLTNQQWLSSQNLNINQETQAFQNSSSLNNPNSDLGKIWRNNVQLWLNIQTPLNNFENAQSQWQSFDSNIKAASDQKSQLFKDLNATHQIFSTQLNHASQLNMLGDLLLFVSVLMLILAWWNENRYRRHDVFSILSYRRQQQEQIKEWEEVVEKTNKGLTGLRIQAQEPNWNALARLLNENFEKKEMLQYQFERWKKDLKEKIKPALVKVGEGQEKLSKIKQDFVDEKDEVEKLSQWVQLCVQDKDVK